MKKKISKISVMIIFSAIAFLSLGIFVVSGCFTAFATFESGGCYYVGNNSSLTIGFGSKFSGGVANYGGGIYVANGGTLTMNGGLIFDNTADFGCGVYVSNGSTFMMNAGLIFNNTDDNLNSDVFVDVGATFTMNGGIIGGVVEFGSYPQTIKADDVTIDESSADSNGYYTGSDGNKYAKVSAVMSRSSVVFSNGESVVSGFDYYFKVEPLKWRILDDGYVDKDGNTGVLLLCESVIDAGGPFGVKVSNTIVNPNKPSIALPDQEEHEANNYYYSYIRTWLNYTYSSYGSGTYSSVPFYYRAFSSDEKELIVQTKVDNTASTTSSSSNGYICSDTTDNVFLMSYQDMLNMDYAFSSSATETDSARQKYTTDFVKASGLTIESDGSSSWWLRSPDTDRSYVTVVRANGTVGETSTLSSFTKISQYDGIVPAIVVDASAIESQLTIEHNVYNFGKTYLYGGVVYDNILNYSSLQIQESTIVEGNITNNDTMYIYGGTFNGSITNKGTMYIYGGTFNGEIINNYASELFIRGGTVNGKIENYGILTVSDGTVNGEITNNQKLEIQNGTFEGLVENLGTCSIERATVRGRVNNSGTITIYSNAWLSGAVSSSKVLTVQGGNPIKGTVSLGKTGTIVLGLYNEGDTLKYNINVDEERTNKTIMTISGDSMVRPDNTEIIITGFNTSNYMSRIRQGSTVTEWVIELKSIEEGVYIPQDFVTLLKDDGGVDTFAGVPQITSLILDRSIPTDDSYSLLFNINTTTTKGNDTTLSVYSTSDKKKIAVVDSRQIYAPEDSTHLFRFQTLGDDYVKLNVLSLNNFDTSKVTKMEGMFEHQALLTSLDVSNFDTSKVTNMKNMFDFCKSLTSLDVSNFDTSKVTSMFAMFYYCKSLTSLDLSNFNTSKVTNMCDMFGNCYSLASLVVSNFDTSNVTDMERMFYGCSSLTDLDVSNFVTSKVTDMSGMFDGCSALTSLNLSSFNMSNVTSCDDMLNFGSDNNIRFLKTPYNNSSALSITTGSTLYNVSTGSSASSVSANTTASLTYTFCSSHSFETESETIWDKNASICYHIETTKKCSVCGYETFETSEGSHSWTEVTTIVGGSSGHHEVKNKICDACGYETIKSVGSTVEHSWKEETTEQSYVSGGAVGHHCVTTISKECEICGYKNQEKTYGRIENHSMTTSVTYSYLNSTRHTIKTKVYCQICAYVKSNTTSRGLHVWNDGVCIDCYCVKDDGGILVPLPGFVSNQKLSDFVDCDFGQPTYLDGVCNYKQDFLTLNYLTIQRGMCETLTNFSCRCEGVQKIKREESFFVTKLNYALLDDKKRYSSSIVFEEKHYRNDVIQLPKIGT